MTNHRPQTSSASAADADAASAAAPRWKILPPIQVPTTRNGSSSRNSNGNNDATLRIASRRRRRRLRRPVAVSCLSLSLSLPLSLLAVVVVVVLLAGRYDTDPSCRWRGGMMAEAHDATPNNNNNNNNSHHHHHVSSSSSSSTNPWGIPRGGANRFLPDDDSSNNDSNNNNNNNNDRERLSEKLNAVRRRWGNRNNGVMERHSSNNESSHSPVVYQYFGKSRSRGSHHPLDTDSESPLNFIVLGPNVDHWKTVGQTLASRGFNVMACERMIDKGGGGSNSNSNNSNNNEAAALAIANQYDDAPELWNRAVLVGCDGESVLAMETAMMLAPDRVAGLVLCGDLAEANRFAAKNGGTTPDVLLRRNLDCPFAIVWDGGEPSSPLETFGSGNSGTGSDEPHHPSDERCVVLGGGSAPHRTKPEYFAWVLARFVEEKLEHHPRDYLGGKMRRAVDGEAASSSTALTGDDRRRRPGPGPRPNRGRILRNLNLPFGIDSLVSPEGRLLLGRAVAAAIFYTSCARVAVVQYGILRAGVVSVKNSVDSVGALRKKIFQATGGFLAHYGYLPRLFRWSFGRAEEDAGGGNSDAGDASGGSDNDNDNNNNNNNHRDAAEDAYESEQQGEDNEEIQNDEYNENDDDEDPLRVKPLFFLDNIFT
eukprot:jgi/Psemu1/56338/gm1.56338_g